MQPCARGLRFGEFGERGSECEAGGFPDGGSQKSSGIKTMDCRGNKDQWRDAGKRNAFQKGRTMRTLALSTILVTTLFAYFSPRLAKGG
jgi:hypothetical protein